MPKCYLHGETAKKEPTKPLQEHPGWPDTIKNNFQQNLNLILEPSKETYRQKEVKLAIKEKELEKDFQQKDLDREKEKEEFKKELEQEINQWEINFQHLQQVKDNEITEKDNRIAQLDKLFKGTATIFQKQHNFVDHLKEKLKKEQTEKGISEEKSKHLQADIEQLDQQKKELGQRIKELEKEEKNSKAIRDKEIEELKERVRVLESEKLNEKEIEVLDFIYALSLSLYDISSSNDEKCYRIDLINNLKVLGIKSYDYTNTNTTTADFPHKLGECSIYSIISMFKKGIEGTIGKIKKDKQKIANLTQTIKELTEVKMAREKSEERLKKQSEDFLQVQQMNQVVYDILGEYSDKTGLLLRSQEVCNIIKIATDLVNCVDLSENEIKDKIAGARENTKLYANIIKVLDEYRKEKFWWDKWIDKEEEGLCKEVRDILFEELPEEIKKEQNKKYSIREITSYPPRELKEKIKRLCMFYRNR